MEIVNIHSAKSRLSELIQKVLNGEKVIIANNNVPVAELKPLLKNTMFRTPGLLKGKIKARFDDLKLDKEIEDMFYNSKLYPDENTD